MVSLFRKRPFAAMTINWNRVCGGRKLGCKWTMALCAVAYAPFMAANLHAEFYTLVPGALVAGAGAGPAWCALSTYTSLAGERSARARDAAAADVEAATARLYSLFYTVYQLNQVSGNLVSSLDKRAVEQKT
ncbi:UNC93-like protein [Gryllus bimaculatus]|nr:UNC93-like protein [Gryllus bimaculatus]